jgi:hypothetical protein
MLEHYQRIWTVNLISNHWLIFYNLSIW